MRSHPTTASWSKCPGARQTGVYWRLKNGRAEYGFLRPLGNLEYAGTTLQSAVDARSAALLRKSAGTPTPNTKLRVRDLVEELRESKRTRLKASSFASLEFALDKIILPELGHLRPVQVTAARIESLVRSLERRLSADSVKRYLSPLNELLNRAVQHGCVPSNAWATLTADQRPRKSDHPERFEWTQDALGSLLEAARTLDERPTAQQKYYAIISTLAMTGARVSEVLALRWQDVDLLAGTISIRHSLSRDGKLTTPKTRAGHRTVPIPEPLLRVLVDHKPEDAADEAWVFPARHKHGPVSYHNFRVRAFVEVLKIAGLDDSGITIHDLRHCAASLLIAAGLSPVEVAGQLGHANATVTMAVYAQAFDRSSADDRIRSAFEDVAA